MLVGSGYQRPGRAVLPVFGGGVAPPVTRVLRAITTQNRMNIGAENRFVTDCWVRWPAVVAAETDTAVLSFAPWWNLGSGAGEFDLANDVTILEAALERSATGNSTVTATTPVLFSGGRSKTLSAGMNDVQCDPILASLLGTTAFTSGTWYWFKARLRVPTTSGSIPYSDRAVSNVSGSQVAWFDPAVTTPSSVDTLGPFTSTGTAPSTRANGFCPIFLGLVSPDAPSEGAVGDSITTITADNGANTTAVHGVGWFQRSRHDAGTAVTNLRPGILCGRVGAATTHFVGTNTRWRAYIKYAKNWNVGLGTNDIGTSSSGTVPAATLTNLLEINTAFKNGGAVKTGMSKTIPRTLSSDAWATLANQTPQPGWRAGDKASQLNDWIDARLADGTINFKINMTSPRDTTEPLKWRVTGVANATTSDGTHPTALTMEDMAQEARVVFGGL